MVNSCLKKLKFHLASFDIVIKERTTATAITEGTWGFEHTKAWFRDEIIPFVKNLKELFTSFDQRLIDEVTEVQNIFKQIELAVEQHCAEKTKFQTKMENVLKENDRLLTQALSAEIVNIVVHDYVNVDCLNMDACVHCVATESEVKLDFIKKECYEMLLQQYHILETHCISLEVNNQLNREIFQRDTVSSSKSAPTFAELFEINELKAQIQEKDIVILKLKEKLKSFSGDVKERKVEREVKEIETQNLELDHKAHSRRSGTLREIVESERLLSLLNTSLAYACKYTRRIQELLMILQQTYPSIIDLGTNLVAVTLKNKTKQIRRTVQITKSERTTIATSPLANIDSNTPVLSSTGVTLVSSASGSKSQDNTKKNRIRRTQKKAMETGLEDHLRNVKSSLNKASVVDSKATSSVIKYGSNVNSNLKCASCNGCLFFDNHDACVVAYINSVNASKKSKSVKTPVKRKELPKVSMVNSCLKKLKYHLASFDVVVKERTTAPAITEGTWGFEHTKACFRDDIIPFVKNLKDLFTSFDQYLIDEVSEVQKIFKQMEMAVEQNCAAKTEFQTKMESVLKENDHLLKHALVVDIVNIVVNDCMNVNCLTVDACKQCVTTESELKTDFIKKENYETDNVSSSESALTFAELFGTNELKRDIVSSPESAPTFAELFEINDLKAQVQEKDTVILKLKEKLMSFSGDVKERKVEREVEEIKTLNLEFDHK
nr:hypothetical protein [Tanacetum cinerariifolium]